MAIEAAVWRDERAQKQGLTLAWATAALSRAKRLPPLARLTAKPARKLQGRELEERRREFAEMRAALARSSAATARKQTGKEEEAG